MGKMTVMTGPERRRRWSDEERIQILAEAFAPGASVSAVARRHDISTARIYTWRSRLRQTPAPTEFAEAVVDDGEQEDGPRAAIPVIIVDLGGKGCVSISAAASAHGTNGVPRSSPPISLLVNGTGSSPIPP